MSTQLASTERETLSAFVARLKITAEIEWADSNPHMSASDDWHRSASHYKVILKRGRKRMTVYFSVGSAHTREPEIPEVLDSLTSDAAGFVNAQNFEDWCSEYGYDTDSRTAEKTFKVVEAQTGKLEQFLGDEYEHALWQTERE